MNAFFSSVSSHNINIHLWCKYVLITYSLHSTKHYLKVLLLTSPLFKIMIKFTILSLNSMWVCYLFSFTDLKIARRQPMASQIWQLVKELQSICQNDTMSSCFSDSVRIHYMICHQRDVIIWIILAFTYKINTYLSTPWVIWRTNYHPISQDNYTTLAEVCTRCLLFEFHELLDDTWSQSQIILSRPPLSTYGRTVWHISL